MQVPRNLADAIRLNAHNVNVGANRAAIRWGNHEWSWTELDEKVESGARVLRRTGQNRPDTHPARVAIALPNSVEFVIAYLATLRAGLIAVPINPAYTGRELHELLADSAASVLVTSAEAVSTLAQFAAPLPDLVDVYVAGDGDVSGVDLAAPVAHVRVAPFADLATMVDPTAATDGEDPTAGGQAEAPDGEGLAVLLYTSGTEGRAKGAMLSHRALLANHRQLAEIEPPPIGPDDVVLLAVPLFHAFGLNGALGAVAYHGASGVLAEPSDPATALRLIAEHQVTVLVGVPAMYSAWADLADTAALASVRLAVSGAAPLDAATARRFEAVAGRPLFVGYGLTETAPVLTTTLVSSTPKSGSIGRPIPGVDLRLVSATGSDVWRSDDPAGVTLDDFDDDAAGSPGTDPGEIVVRGRNLFSGYWPDGRGGPNSDGWWPTTDVAYADADGDLFLVDRLRELIIVNGFNVYPAEVEHVLEAHPAVAEAAVIGVPSATTGQAPEAYVVASGPVTVEELADHCARNLARFKCPVRTEFVSELPHSATGKVRKSALRSAPDVTAPDEAAPDDMRLGQTPPDDMPLGQAPPGRRQTSAESAAALGSEAADG